MVSRVLTGCRTVARVFFRMLTAVWIKTCILVQGTYIVE